MPALGYARRAMKVTPWIRDYPMDERELIRRHEMYGAFQTDTEAVRQSRNTGPRSLPYAWGEITVGSCVRII
jgi:hypothetical protein